MKYRFDYIDHCSFCGSPDFRILGKRLNKSQGKAPKRKLGITTTIVKCSCCGLVYPNPLPIPEDIQDHYGVPPENYWKPEYFIMPDDYRAGLFQWMNSIRKIDENAKILDIGAGIGKTMKALKNRGYNAYGIEPSLPFYERAVEQMSVDRDKLKLISVEDAEFEENFFDVVFFAAVLEHMYNPSEILRKVLRWVKPGGLIFIEVPNADWFFNKVTRLYYKIIGTDYVSNLSPMHAPYHLYEFTLEAFKIHAKKNDYEIVCSKYNVCETFLPKIVDPFVKKYMQITNTGMDLALWLRKK